MRARHVIGFALFGCLFGCLVLASGPAGAQVDPELPIPNAQELIQLDFTDVELSVVIDTIARLTNKNFIYDDRVRGRVTIVSPRKITLEQAYAVFEAVLKVKGFTAVAGPGGVLKVLPIRDAKESNIETIKDGRPSPNRDQFVTRLIPLRYIDAESITNTVKPLVSKDASMVAYAPTNTIILTDTSSNIRRLLSIIDAIDIETHREELAVIKIENADAATLGEQIAEIYEAQTGTTTPARRTRTTTRRRTTTPSPTSGASGQRAGIRIITDSRTNSLIVLASRSALEDIRALVRKLDVPVQGGGRIHVYYLKHADAEELAQTLSGLVGGGRATPGGGRTGAASGAPQALASTVTALTGGVSISADPSTNALVIQASKEAYETITEVIRQLDIARPQVLVEALIMEVDVSDGLVLGFNGLVRLAIGDNSSISISSLTDAATSDDVASTAGMAAGGPAGAIAAPFAANFLRQTFNSDGQETSLIRGVIRAAANDDAVNIVSAPHILTSDNEEAEIRIGNNIPIITSRIQSAQGQIAGVASSVNVERQDIGVTLRVTPQISEGNTLRLKIFQEITQVNETLTDTTGTAEQVGVALSNRRIENTVVVADGETVVVGGLLSEVYEDNVVKVPFLGDIPILGWLFKTVETTLRKENLLVFLTPHIVRSPADLERETIRKREQFQERLSMDFDEAELVADSETPDSRSPVRVSLRRHSMRYPLERMQEIEQEQADRYARLEETRATDQPAARFGIRADVFRDEVRAADKLTEVLDAGYEATLVSGTRNGALRYELQVGPFDTLKQADDVSAVLQRSFGLDPSVTIVPLEIE